MVNKLLDEHGYLRDEDFSLKRKIQESIQKHFQMYEEFVLNKPSIDLNVHNHFQVKVEIKHINSISPYSSNLDPVKFRP